jgi:hypothetical protein
VTEAEIVGLLSRAEIPPLHYASLRSGRNDSVGGFLSAEWCAGWASAPEDLHAVGLGALLSVEPSLKGEQI